MKGRRLGSASQRLLRVSEGSHQITPAVALHLPPDPHPDRWKNRPAVGNPDEHLPMTSNHTGSARDAFATIKDSDALPIIHCQEYLNHQF